MKKIEQLLSSLRDNDKEDGDVYKDPLEAIDDFLGYEAFTILYEDPLITLTYNIKS